MLEKRVQLGVFAGALLVLGLWLPWATVTLLGIEGPTANGMEIGSDILDLPVGWIAAAGGLVGGLGASRLDGKMTLIGGVLALLVTGYALLAIPGQEANISANGVPLDGSPIQIEYAWGLFALVASALALVINGVLLIRAEKPARPRPIEP